MLALLLALACSPGHISLSGGDSGSPGSTAEGSTLGDTGTTGTGTGTTKDTGTTQGSTGTDTATGTTDPGTGSGSSTVDTGTSSTAGTTDPPIDTGTATTTDPPICPTCTGITRMDSTTIGVSYDGATSHVVTTRYYGTATNLTVSCLGWTLPSSMLTIDLSTADTSTSGSGKMTITGGIGYLDEWVTCEIDSDQGAFPFSLDLMTVWS